MTLYRRKQTSSFHRLEQKPSVSPIVGTTDDVRKKAELLHEELNRFRRTEVIVCTTQLIPDQFEIRLEQVIKPKLDQSAVSKCNEAPPPESLAPQQLRVENCCTSFMLIL